MRVIVWTDHIPLHFHVEKIGEYDVRIDIKTLKILSYKWQKNNKEMSSTEMKNLKDWLEKKSIKDKTITNLRGIKFAWKILNP